MTELFAVLARAAGYLTLAARIAFSNQTIKLAPVMRKIHPGVISFAFVTLLLAAASGAQGAGSSAVEDGRAPASMYRDGISLDEAVRQAEAQYHARVVRTDIQDEDGRKVYVLKLLTEDGRVITVRINAGGGRSR